MKLLTVEKMTRRGEPCPCGRSVVMKFWPGVALGALSVCRCGLVHIAGARTIQIGDRTPAAAYWLHLRAASQKAMRVFLRHEPRNMN